MSVSIQFVYLLSIGLADSYQMQYKIKLMICLNNAKHNNVVSLDIRNILQFC